MRSGLKIYLNEVFKKQTMPFDPNSAKVKLNFTFAERREGDIISAYADITKPNFLKKNEND